MRDFNVDWSEWIAALEGQLVYGMKEDALTGGLRQQMADLGLSVQGDPEEVLLRGLVAMVLLRDTALATTPMEEEATGELEPEWTTVRLIAFRDMLVTEGQWGWVEAAALLRRNGLQVPRALLPLVLEHLRSRPALFTGIAALLPPETMEMARRDGQLSWMYPVGPPAGSRSFEWHLLHWWWQAPEVAEVWWLSDTSSAAMSQRLAFIRAFGQRLPPQALPALQAWPVAEGAWPPREVVTVRSRLGDTALRQQLRERVAQVLTLQSGVLRVSLLPAEQLWTGLGHWDDPDGGRRLAFQELAAALPLGEWVAGMDARELLQRAFASPDAEVLVPALARQLGQYPEPAFRLYWLERVLAENHALDAAARELARGLPHQELSRVLHRYMLRPDVTLLPQQLGCDLLCTPGFFWSEELTQGVVHLLKRLPAMIPALVRYPPFMEAMFARGHLGYWSRQLYAAPPFKDLPAGLREEQERIQPIVERRSALHRAFRV